MADKDTKDLIEELDEEEEEAIVVEMTDEDGNVTYYEEEMVIPIGEDRFALLIGINPEEHHHHHHHDHDHDHECPHHHDHENCPHHHEHHHHDEEEEGDAEVLIAKIKVTEDGEEEYIEPTDEEFEAVLARYEEIMHDETIDEDQ